MASGLNFTVLSMVTEAEEAESIFRLIQGGQFSRAQKRCKKALKKSQIKHDFYHLLALIYLNQNKLRQAEQHIRNSLLEFPGNASALNTFALILGARGHFDRAISKVREAIAINGELLDFHLNHLDLLMKSGKSDDALNLSEKLVRENPNSGEIAYRRARVLYSCNMLEAAVKVLLPLVESVPASVDHVLEVTKILNELQQWDRSLELLNRQLAGRQNEARYFGEIALIHERLNRLESAEEAAIKSLEIADSNGLAVLTLATVYRRQGRYEEAAEFLKGHIVTENRAQKAAVEFERGRLADRTGKYQRAYRSFENGNTLLKEGYKGEGLEGLGKLLTYHKGISADSLQRHATDTTTYHIMGFPRSGTTLLHSILEQHSEITVHDEKPHTQNVIDVLGSFRLNRPYPECLQDLDRQQIEKLSTTYLESLNPEAPVDIDKLPLNTIHLPLLLTMFKDPQVIFCLRHPLDVCLSAFQQQFVMNHYMAPFLDIESTVLFYIEVMDAWQSLSTTFSFSRYILRYEDMLSDPQVEIKSVISFLGLEWDEMLLDDESRANAAKYVSTTSYQQVSQPVYSDAVYRWKNYKEHLEPYFERLAPYVERFGYSI